MNPSPISTARVRAREGVGEGRRRSAKGQVIATDGIVPHREDWGGRGAARRSEVFARLCLIGTVLAASASPAQAEDTRGGLYEAAAIVTGQRDETRVPGMRQCFIDVLQKVSGDQRLAGEAAVSKLADAAPSFVTGFRYHDRLWKRPIHDEQGTRDRPYDLTVDFDPARIDAALAALGRTPWTGPRPRIAAFVAVRQGTVTYLTSTDGPNGYGQADAFADASERTGVPVLVPSQADLAGSRVTEAVVRSDDAAALDAASAALGGAAPLRGTMTFDDAAGGWAVDWRFAWEGRAHRWSLTGVNFDAAFLNGMRGVAQIVSDHGEP